MLSGEKVQLNQQHACSTFVIKILFNDLFRPLNMDNIVSNKFSNAAWYYKLLFWVSAFNTITDLVELEGDNAMSCLSFDLLFHLIIIFLSCIF